MYQLYKTENVLIVYCSVLILHLFICLLFFSITFAACRFFSFLFFQKQNSLLFLYATYLNRHNFHAAFNFLKKYSLIGIITLKMRCFWIHIFFSATFSKIYFSVYILSKHMLLLQNFCFENDMVALLPSMLLRNLCWKITLLCLKRKLRQISFYF